MFQISSVFWKLLTCRYKVKQNYDQSSRAGNNSLTLVSISLMRTPSTSAFFSPNFQIWNLGLAVKAIFSATPSGKRLDSIYDKNKINKFSVTICVEYKMLKYNYIELSYRFGLQYWRWYLQWGIRFCLVHLRYWNTCLCNLVQSLYMVHTIPNGNQ